MEVLEGKLNKRERYKAELSPYAYYPRIETLDFKAISEGDGFYLQDFGIFNTPIDEEEYALRLRITAGRITSSQLRAIAEIAKEHRLDIILTARAGMQLHGLSADNILSVFKQINALGISTWQTFGDNVRNIVTDVYDGRGRHSTIETYPLIMQMEEYFLKTPHLVGMLPRRISVGISGTRANVTSFFANDLYFALAQKGGSFGFNVYMGGKNSEVARDADIFLLQDEVSAFFSAFVEAFNKHGLRFTRTRTRLFHLLESIGLETFKEHIFHEYRQPWQNSGKPVSEKARFSQVEQLRDGTYGFCYETDFGRMKGEELIQIASFAEMHGAQVRLSTDHNIYLLGLPDPSTPFNNLKERATVVACAGSGYCPYSFWNIKDEASLLPLHAIKKHRIQVGISGCPKGCGRHQHSDIGLIGLRTNKFGDADKGARIYLGAEHSDGASVGREIFEMVPLEHISPLLERIIDEYEHSGLEPFETFCAEVLNRYSEPFLSLWFLAKLETGLEVFLPAPAASEKSTPYEAEKLLLEGYFSQEPFLTLIGDTFNEAIRHLSQKLWSVGHTDATIALEIKKLLVSKKYGDYGKLR